MSERFKLFIKIFVSVLFFLGLIFGMVAVQLIENGTFTVLNLFLYSGLVALGATVMFGLISFIAWLWNW